MLIPLFIIVDAQAGCWAAARLCLTWADATTTERDGVAALDGVPNGVGMRNCQHVVPCCTVVLEYWSPPAALSSIFSCLVMFVLNPNSSSLLERKRCTGISVLMNERVTSSTSSHHG